MTDPKNSVSAILDVPDTDADAPLRRNPFLSGVHAPLMEQFTLTELRVSGIIPPGLTGRYLRTGPNPINADPQTYHWFAGDGMVHALVIEAGQARSYSNRWIRSNAVSQKLGVTPAQGPRHSNDNVNTNVVAIGDRVFAVVEAASYPVELGATLDEQRYNPFDGTLGGSFSAHPHRDPKTGDFHAICYDMNVPDTIRHVVVDARARVIRDQPIKVANGPMVHDCAFTDRFVIILDLPVTFSETAADQGSGFPYRWDRAHGARVGLMPRGGTQDEIVWCPVARGYAFHVANAFDDDQGRVVLDVCAFETMFDESIHGPHAPSRGFERWSVDPVGRTVAIHAIDDSPQDFPRCDERFFGQHYRYAWSVALPVEPRPGFVGSSKLYAHDLETGQRQVHDFGHGQVPGEFVFVPEAIDSPEGHGWLIGLVIDSAKDETELVILDARRFVAPPVARVHLPHRIPPGFHGNWIAN